MKKTLTVVLALALLIGCCSFASASEYEHLTATSTAFTVPGFPPSTDNYETQYIEDRWNIHLDILPVDTGTDENWNTFWIDGYADIIEPYSYDAILPLLKEDICRPFPVEWIKEYDPNLWKMMEETFGSESNIMINLCYKGEVYCIPYFYDNGGVPFITSIRKDWMENVGITELPTTIEELEALLDAFTYGDPDKNGVDDTYAMTGTGYGLWNLPAYYGCSNQLNWVKDIEGNCTTTAVSEGYKAYLAQMADWFAKGYIDPEFLTDGRAQIRSKYAQGTIGIYSDHPWWFEGARGEVGPLQMVCGNYPELDISNAFVFFDNLPNADGEVWMLSVFSNIQGQASLYFGYDCPDEVIIRMLQMNNDRIVWYDGSEEDNERIKTNATMDIGVEGEDWVFNPETLECERTEANLAKNADNAASYRSANGLEFYSYAFNTNYRVFKGQEDEYMIDVYDMAHNTNKVWVSSNFVVPPLEASLNDKVDLIQKCFDTFNADIISGTKTIEADWDAYVEEMYSLGLQEVLDAYSE